MFKLQNQTMRYLSFIMLLSIFLLPQEAECQQPDTSTFKGVAAVVFLDSFVVSASRQGFDPEEFIQYVIEDRSFYKAFQNLRRVGYEAENKIDIFDKKSRIKAGYSSQTRQLSDGKCRTMEVLSENDTGKFYKRNSKQYRYYTANLFDRVFFTHGRICEEKPASNSHISELKPPEGRIEKHIFELKKLIFQPGMKADIPLIGSKTEIFFPKMQSLYHYSLLSKDFNGIDCYAFIASPKHEFDESQTIIKYMETFFEKKTFQVVARNYWLKYEGAIFSFNVKMKVKLTKKEDLYLPESVEYEGEWDVPMKAAERSKFHSFFSSFKLP